MTAELGHATSSGLLCEVSIENRAANYSDAKTPNAPN